MYHQLSELYTLASGYGRRAAQSIIGLWIGWEEDRIGGRVYIHDFLGCTVARVSLYMCNKEDPFRADFSQRYKKGAPFSSPEDDDDDKWMRENISKRQLLPLRKKRDSFLAMPDPDKTLLVCVQEGMKKKEKPPFVSAILVIYIFNVEENQQIISVMGVVYFYIYKKEEM